MKLKRKNSTFETIKKIMKSEIKHENKDRQKKRKEEN